MSLKRQLYDVIVHPFRMEAGGRNRHLTLQALHTGAEWALRETMRIAWCVFWLALWEYVRRTMHEVKIVKGETDANQT